MKHFDIHVHFNVDDAAKIEFFAKTCRENETFAAMSGGLRYGGHDYLPNEQVLDWCRMYPVCLVPMAKLDLGSDAYIDYPYLIGDARRGYEQLLDANGVPPEIRRGVLGATAASWFGIELE